MNTLKSVPQVSAVVDPFQGRAVSQSGQVALDGDPRTSNESIQAVFASGLSSTGGDIDKAADAGLQFMKKLNESGNFVPIGGGPSTLAGCPHIPPEVSVRVLAGRRYAPPEPWYAQRPDNRVRTVQGGFEVVTERKAGGS